MLLDFDKEKEFAFKWENKEYKVSYARKSDLEAFASVKDLDPETKEAQDAAYMFLEKVGVKRDVSEKLPFKCVIQLVNESAGVEKK